MRFKWIRTLSLNTTHDNLLIVYFTDQSPGDILGLYSFKQEKEAWRIDHHRVARKN